MDVAHQIDPARLLERHEVVRPVGGGAPRVRRERVLPLERADEIARLRKRGLEAGGTLPRRARRVVTVEMREDDRVDVVGREASPRERSRDVAG